AEGDAALSAADHDDVGLALVAEFALFPFPLLRPGPASSDDAVLDPLRAPRPPWFLESLEFPQGGEQCPRALVGQAEMPLAAAGGGVELQPCLDDPVGLGRGLGDAKTRRGGVVQACVEQVRDAFASLDGLDVP